MDADRSDVQPKSRSDLDPLRLEFFVGRYRKEEAEGLDELAGRFDDLSDEAQAALRQVRVERGLNPSAPIAREDVHREMDIDAQTTASSELLNGALSRSTRNASCVPGIVFAAAVLGQQGVFLGAIPLTLLAAFSVWSIRHAVSARLREICAEADVPIEVKIQRIKTMRVLLIGSLVPAALLGATIANALR